MIHSQRCDCPDQKASSLAYLHKITFFASHPLSNRRCQLGHLPYWQGTVQHGDPIGKKDAMCKAWHNLLMRLLGNARARSLLFGTLFVIPKLGEGCAHLVGHPFLWYETRSENN